MAGSTHLAVINFGTFIHGSATARRQIAAEVDAALRQDGFFYIQNHGIPEELVRAWQEQSRAFFALPDEAKIHNKASPETPYGFSPFGAENVRGGAFWKESFSFNANGAADPQREATWPAEAALPGFKASMLDFFSRCSALMAQLLECLSLALSLPPASGLAAHHRRADASCSLIHYLATPRPVDGETLLRCPAHADFGTLTLLFQDGVGGLEIADAGPGGFRAVPPVPGTVVVNAGYLLMRWTEQRWKSAVHRVVEPPGSAGDGGVVPERLSLAFFIHPDQETVLEALPGCAEGVERRYAPLGVGEYLRKKRVAMYAA